MAAHGPELLFEVFEQNVCHERWRRDLCRFLCRRCCAGDGGLLALQRRPSGDGAKPPCAALAEDRRGERSGKRRAWCVRWGPGRRSRKRPVEGSRVGVRCWGVVIEIEVASKARGLFCSSWWAWRVSRLLARWCPA